MFYGMRFRAEEVFEVFRRPSERRVKGESGVGDVVAETVAWVGPTSSVASCMI